MKIVKVQIELVISEDDNVFDTASEEKIYPRLYNESIDRDKIAHYLNNKLYTDPDFFGGFGPENIIEIREFD